MNFNLLTLISKMRLILMLEKKTIKQNTIAFFLYLFFWIFQFYIIFPIESFFTSKLSLYLPSLIFLPHGIRVIFCLVYGKRIFLGLFLSHIISGIFITNSYFEIIFGALGSTLSAYIALWIVYKKVEVNFININLNNIIALSFVSSLINGLSSILVKQEQFNINYFFQYTIGDFIGVLILLLLINNNKKNILNFLKKI